MDDPKTVELSLAEAHDLAVRVLTTAGATETLFDNLQGRAKN